MFPFLWIFKCLLQRKYLSFWCKKTYFSTANSKIRDEIICQDSTLNSEKNHAEVFISAVQAENEFSQSKRSSASNVA